MSRKFQRLIFFTKYCSLRRQVFSVTIFLSTYGKIASLDISTTMNRVVKKGCVI